jgi:hypothetical protein
VTPLEGYTIGANAASARTADGGVIAMLAGAGLTALIILAAAPALVV